jgi:transcriptional regulator with XRE-family HTH domain
MTDRPSLLLAARKRRGLTLAEASMELKIDPGTISRLERGVYVVTDEMWERAVAAWPDLEDGEPPPEAGGRVYRCPRLERERQRSRRRMARDPSRAERLGKRRPIVWTGLLRGEGG